MGTVVIEILNYLELHASQPNMYMYMETDSKILLEPQNIYIVKNREFYSNYCNIHLWVSYIDKISLMHGKIADFLY